MVLNGLLLAVCFFCKAALLPVFDHLKHLARNSESLRMTFFLSCKTIGYYICGQDVVGRTDTLKLFNDL